jgi:hypothetical protein
LFITEGAASNLGNWTQFNLHMMPPRAVRALGKAIEANYYAAQVVREALEDMR